MHICIYLFNSFGVVFYFAFCSKLCNATKLALNWTCSEKWQLNKNTTNIGTIYFKLYVLPLKHTAKVMQSGCDNLKLPSLRTYLQHPNQEIALVPMPSTSTDLEINLLASCTSSSNCWSPLSPKDLHKLSLWQIPITNHVTSKTKHNKNTAKTFLFYTPIYTLSCNKPKIELNCKINVPHSTSAYTCRYTRDDIENTKVITDNKDL